MCWDVGCGSGQASVDLAEVFERVHATDLAAGQVAEAKPHPRVTYQARPAHDSGLPDGSADAVCAAQAVHWFDVPEFHAEARRVAAPGAVAVFWSYAFHRSGDAAVDAVMRRFGREVLGPYWRPELRTVWDRYASLKFPFRKELETPRLHHDLDWSLPELVGYWSSWSAWKAYEKERGASPLAEVAGELRAAWGAPGTKRTLRAELGLRAGLI
ncbi:MAG: class I SAM-dependent methyltransferase [Elusimicrobia bacterium]|nr:class I SAM-dependent methyltransferase [Elusimicrobiota bacterium]